MKTPPFKLLSRLVLSGRGTYFAGYMTITPKLAQQFLDDTSKNPRPLKKALIARYLRDLRTGNWDMGEQVITLNNEGRMLSLINGRNTCAAIVLYGKAVPLLVQFGPFTPRSIGQGNAHAAYLKFIWDGDPKGRNRVARLRVIWLLVHGRYAPSLSPAHAQEINKVFRDGLDWAADRFPGMKHLGSAPVAGALAFAYKAHPKRIEGLSTRLIAKVPRHERDPAAHILDMCFNTVQAHNGMRQRQSAHTTLNAAYHAVKGQPVKGLLPRPPMVEHILGFYNRAKVDKALSV